MNDYLTELQRDLNQLNANDANDVLDFYTEYLQDGGFETYEEAASELGTPKQLSHKVLADYAIQAIDEPQANPATRNQPRHTARTIWLILLAIMSTPITIPLAIAAVIALVAFLIGIAAVILGIIAAFVGVLIAGILSLAVGVGILGQSISTGILYLGGGLLILGLFGMLVPVMIWLVRGLISLTLKFSRWLYRKFSRQNRAKEGRY